MVAPALQITWNDYQSMPIIGPGEDTAHIYAALENLSNSLATTEEIFATVGKHLHDLFFLGCENVPSTTALQTIMWALRSERTYDSQIVRQYAISVLCLADHWFSVDELQPVLQENWAWLGYSSHNVYTGSLGPRWYTGRLYITLGHKICKIPTWKNIISQDLPTLA